MDKRDLLDIKNASKEIYSLFFSNEIEFRYLESTTDSIYKEKKRSKKKYSDPLILTGKVDLNPTKEEIRSDIGASEVVNARFEVPSIDLEKNGMLERLDELRNGLITYQDKEYNILGISPVTNVDEIFIFYEFETRSENES